MDNCEKELRRCIYSMKYGTHEAAKKHFEKSWQARINEGCINPVINEALDYMRPDFYPVKKGGGMNCSDYGAYYEGRILARAESDYD